MERSQDGRSEREVAAARQPSESQLPNHNRVSLP